MEEEEEAGRTEQNECNDNENFLQPKTKPKKKRKKKNQKARNQKTKKNQHNYHTRSLSLLLSFPFLCLSVCPSQRPLKVPTYLTYLGNAYLILP